MIGSMTTNFVAGLGNSADKKRVFPGDPPQHEERGCDVVAIEHGQNAIHILLHTRAAESPLSFGHAVGKSLDVKVVFHIDCQNICDAHGYTAKTVCTAKSGSPFELIKSRLNHSELLGICC